MSLPGSSSLADLVKSFSAPAEMSAPPAPPVPASPLAPSLPPGLVPPTGPSASLSAPPRRGTDWGGIAEQNLPMIMALIARKTGGPLAGAATLEGFARGQMQKREAEREAHELELQTIQDAQQRAAKQAEFQRTRAMQRESWVRELQNDLDKINDPDQFAAVVSRAAKYGAPLHDMTPDEVSSQFKFPDARIGQAAKATAASRLETLRKVHGDNFEALLRQNAVDQETGKTLQDLQATAGLQVVDAQGAPILPPPTDEFKLPNSDVGLNLGIDIAAEEERLGRRLKPGERQKVRDRFLAKRAEAQRAARARGGSGAGTVRPPRNPRGTNAIPQGVERYIIDMRNRGYLQADAMTEMFGRDVWANMQRDHPGMTAERAREAIARLIPEEGAAVPMPASAPSGARGGGPGGQPSAGAEVPEDRVITRAELKAAAQRLGIPEDEARGEYEARGFVIR